MTTVESCNQKQQFEITFANFEEMKQYLSDDKNIKSQKIGLVFKSVDVDNFSLIQRFFQCHYTEITDFLYIHECSNTFTEKDCENIAEYLKKMNNLQSLQLFLRLNKINSGIVFISKILPCLQNLQKVSFRMQSNGIDNEGLKTISEGLSQLPNLQEIELMLLGNEITDIGSLRQLTNLKNMKKFHFQITKNNVTLEQIIEMVDYLQSCESLRYLTLDIQQLHFSSEESMKILMNKICDMAQLESLSLDLENSKISPELVEMFTQRISKMKKILKISLNFKNNQLRDIGCQNIKKMLLQMPQLTSLGLILDINQVTTIGIEDLIEGISALKYINQLYFSIMANHSDKINSIYSKILSNTQYLSQVQIHASGRFKQISEEFANYYKQIYVMLLQMSVFINNFNEYQIYNPCFIMQDLFYD
ncbi:kinase domain protein, putative (macronuclear) [Tetrahymena thermophila SB210]|uniref:Kinase domain protein, putative n=1 Tax=Tetrahymena thermophila (strain SB210) TaxID=312017 RepID=I7MMW5_TETTS|nr:kinase domain protein, putative [Tetrahymena thermophila SB210]EAS07099.1 kinase domain protein, putative [Tetrahymena thermophila SB210]|eukprot:XP_001027341.1 kinase domain protein, putative [Tetrahymena thermophila SB210]